MAKGYATTATIEHVKYLAPRLRKEDREECLASACADPSLAFHRRQGGVGPAALGGLLDGGVNLA